ncbi:MAG: tRNA guanosine(34) transglycosylase Tgt [Acidobacteriota bacterium]
MSFSFEVTRSDAGTSARRGVLRTPHGEIDTPVFMPVATYGAVRSLSPDELLATGSRLLLANTYHLYLRPGEETLDRFEGLHRFISWSGPILTDSGGFQVFSLADLGTVREDGVVFRSHLDGSEHLLTPEISMRIQRVLGSDICMALDECPPATASRERIVKAMQRTTDWAVRCKRAFEQRGQYEEGRALFGIVQGGVSTELRREHAAMIVAEGFQGYAVGGVSVGEPPDQVLAIGELMGGLLPADSPRYMMGLGSPADLVRLIGYGFDMFDCVMPTRNGRNGKLFTSTGALNIKNLAFKRDARPIDEDCDCYACRRFSRAYLRHLFMSKEILGHRLNSLHNLTYYQRLMSSARRAIELGEYACWRDRVLARMNIPDPLEQAP